VLHDYLSRPDQRTTHHWPAAEARQSPVSFHPDRCGVSGSEAARPVGSLAIIRIAPTGRDAGPFALSVASHLHGLLAGDKGEPPCRHCCGANGSR
jgi:hypothetical protein